MATTCRTADGDMLDSLCYHDYGHLLGCVEATLDANPGLADEQQPFRAGLLISFPDMPVVNVEQVRLWD
ncbi:tail protein X [Pseudomonas aeruginosa]|uniref:tail protein X n=1 Tax=Pseudomonas aeruginosa TaxID=287 RepID=UPI0021E3462D|nr:tail protein X [Pseudomonas aeruginosa]MCV0248404.1 tail protein X [Pseudomonas aeruginosa]